MIRSFSKTARDSGKPVLLVIDSRCVFTYISGGTKTAVTTTMFVVVVLASITPYPALGLVHALFWLARWAVHAIRCRARYAPNAF